MGSFRIPSTWTAKAKMTRLTKSEVNKVANTPMERVRAKPFTSVAAV